MKYGNFSKDSKEYIITDPRTPTPWMNYISNSLGYCGIVSQSGGGFSFIKDPRDRRITKYRYNSIPYDRPGRYIYIKNEETKEYWSPAWQPVMKDLDLYECRHGQGYTVIRSGYKKIKHTVSYFVPVNHTCELWHLEVHNTGTNVMNLSLYSYCEFTHWSEPESRNIQWALHLTRCFLQDNRIIYPLIEPHPAFSMEENRNYDPLRAGMAFMGTNREIADFECSRDAFIGMYQSETNPRGVEQDSLSNSILEGGVPCAALRSTLSLKPDEKKELIVVLGFALTMEEAASINLYYSRPENVTAGLEEVKESWKKYCSRFPVSCSDDDISSVISTWNPYQCKTAFDWSRYISFYENGEGRGMGVRDSCQDALSICAYKPEAVRERIIDIISACQFENGSCYHQYFPLYKKGNLKGFSDDHLWLIVMVYFYIAETRDYSLLNAIVPFAGSRKKSSLYEHLLAAVHYTREQKGPHGLPLILVADWNDTLHLWMTAEQPESVFVAELFVYTCNLLGALAEGMGKKTDAAALGESARDMADRINERCWDGHWYVRGFGNKTIGTKENRCGKIFLNSQVWAVISGVARRERAVECMNSVREYLYTPLGIKLLSPAFDGYDNDHGLISRYVKGRKENGIFAHAQSWAIVAECLLGRNSLAFDYYSSILPIKRNHEADVLRTEPYVYCQTISSDDSLYPGQGANSWLTGTASWMYIAFTQYILGIRPTLDGLVIQPRIPGEWAGFKAERMYLGCRYQINCTRTGRPGIRVNGSAIKGALLSPQQGKECQVDVEI